MQNKLQNDTENIAVWTGITTRLNSLVKGSPEASKIKNELIALKDEASLKNALNNRQTEAINARVDNYLNGTFGNTKSYEPNEYDTGRIKG